MTPRRWPWALAALFILCGVAGWTGSSYGAYGATDRLLGPRERTRRELVGSARGIRSDEWAIDLPLGRAQQTATPSFPLVNADLGLGQLQRHPFGSVVLDWGVLFRPHLWPLLLGSLASHGVRWFVRSALLLLGLQGWLSALTRPARAEPEDRARRAGLAAVAALAVFFSSWLTWWLSHAQAEIIAFAGIAVAAAARASEASTRTARLLWTGAVGYASACAFFNFYAPAWAPALWLLCGGILDVTWRAEPDRRRAVRSGVALVAVAAAGVVLSILYYAPYLALIADTVYPGRRVAASGELPPGRLVDMMWPALETWAPLRGGGGYRGRVPGMNECEAACVEVMPFFLLAALALVEGSVRDAVRRALRRVPWTAAASAVLAIWLVVPLPAWAGYATLLRWTPWNRAWLPFGVGCAALATAALAELECVPSRAGPRWREPVVAAAVLLLSWSVARSLVRVDARLLATSSVAAGLAVAGCAFLRSRWGPRILATSWLVPLVLANGAVNPILPTRALFARGEGHAAVDAALRERPGRIVDYTGAMGSVLAGFGWPVLNALQMAPDLDMFRFLAPDAPGLTPEVYNRYAHVRFVLPPAMSRVEQADAFQLAISPCSERLAALGVNHVLAPASARIPPECAAAFDVRPAGALRLWSRRDPVARWGVARTESPRGALDFDFSERGARLAARVQARRDGLLVELPSGAKPVAVPIFVGAVDSVRCDAARARLVDAHLIVAPAGAAAATCEVTYMGTIGGVRRLVRGGGPRVQTADEAQLTLRSGDDGR